MEYTHAAPLFGAGITLNWQPPVAALRAAAVAAAQKSDIVVAFVGLSPHLEGEEMSIQVPGFSGGDRTDLDLPAEQQKMLEAVAATGKPLVVVLMNGSALAVNWAQQHAAAILEAWYPGEAGGTAIADTLLGRYNPAGRLPVTFYAGIDQLPTFDDYAMQGRTYRYSRATPLYRFGDGLSYTHFRYSGAHLSTATLAAGDPLSVTVNVANTGRLPGDEVVEVYLTPPASELSPVRAPRRLPAHPSCARRGPRGHHPTGPAPAQPGGRRRNPRRPAGTLPAVRRGEPAGSRPERPALRDHRHADPARITRSPVTAPSAHLCVLRALPVCLYNQPHTAKYPQFGPKTSCQVPISQKPA